MSKILNIMLSPSRGGLEWVFVKHVQALTNTDNDNYAICLKNCAYKKELQEVLKTPLLEISSRSRYNLMTYITLIKYILKIKPNIICMHGNRTISLITSKLIKLFLPATTKLVATTHNYRNKHFIHLDAMFAITKDLMLDLKKRDIPEQRIFYCPNTVAIPPQQMYKQHQIPTIGVLGRLHPVKGYDILLEAIAMIKTKNVPFKLLIGGDGEERNKLQKQCKALNLENQVKFLGWVNNKKAFFEKIDIFCVPSRSEALGISFLEALSYGKPSIISRCNGLVEVISQYNAALISELEDPRSLAKNLLELLLNKNKCIQLSNLGYKSVAEFYSDKSLQKNLIKMINYLKER